MRLRNHPLFLFLAIFIGLAMASPVDARQALTDAKRQAIMDQEMDCITKNFDSGGKVSWQSTCSSQHSSSRQDIAKLDETSNYNDSSYSDYAQKSKTSPSYYQDEGRTYTDWGDEYGYGQLDTFGEDPYDSKDLHYNYGGSSDSDKFIQADVRLLVGQRMDDFNFNIASDITGSATPNIISELTWSDLKMTQIRTEAQIAIKNHFILDGMGTYVDIYNGDNQDSDYLGNDRTFEVSRSNNASKDGEAMEWSLGAGYRIYLGDNVDWLASDDIWLTLLGGYAYRELNLIMTDGLQTIPATGSFESLHHNYWAEWNGPWAGFELKGSRNKIFGMARFEYHWMDFDATANWNLRQDFEHPTSFHQWADANGVIFGIGAGYHLTDHWDLDLRFNYQDLQADHGVIQFFKSDGSKPQQRLNEANWESKAFMLGSTYRF